MAKDRTVTVKKGCCKSKPRCKRCPVVCKRLEQAGFAERISKREYVVSAPKTAVKAARARA